MDASSVTCSARQVIAPAMTSTAMTIKVRLSHGRITMAPMLARIALALMVFATPATAATPLPAQPSPVPWPTMEWPAAPLPAGVDKQKLDKLLEVTDHALPDLGETRAVVIVQRGQ